MEKICKKCGKKKEASNFPTDNSAKDKLWRFCRYCEYVRKHPTDAMTEKEWLAKRNAPKGKKAAKKPSKIVKTSKKAVKGKSKKEIKGESIADLQKRINDLSPKSTGIHIKNVTKEIQVWAETEGYAWESDNVLYVGKKAT